MSAKSNAVKLRTSIDLGTNTCLLLIAEMDGQNPGAVKRIVEDCATIVRLGEGVDQNRCFAVGAMERTRACLQLYAEKVRAQGLDPKDTIAVGTSQARDSSNAAEFFAEIEKSYGFRFRVLSGEEEAVATFQGALVPGCLPEQTVVIDIGGGSTEWTTQKGGISLDIGSVRFTERYLHSDPVTDAEFWQCREEIDRAIESARDDLNSLGVLPAKQLLGVAGTITTLGSWFLGQRTFDRVALDGVELTRGDIHRMVEDLKWRTVAERRQLPGVEPGRAGVLLAGAMILWRSMELLDQKSLKISTRGLRFGVLGLGDRAFFLIK